MKEEIYRWVKTIAFFYIVFSAVLHLVPDVKYERYIRSFMGILLIYILSTPVFNLFGNGEKTAAGISIKLSGRTDSTGRKKYRKSSGTLPAGELQQGAAKRNFEKM
mgnify:CR=1 FL=1